MSIKIAFFLFLSISGVFCDENFVKLPNTIRPFEYFISFNFSSDFSSDSSYTSEISIKFETLANISEIKLHSYGHSVLEGVIMSEDFSYEKEINETIELSDHVVCAILPEELGANKIYVLFIKFTGNITLNSDHGLFRSSFIKENEDTDYHLVTNFKSFKAHHVFPCYDDPEYRASFQIGLQRMENFNVVSNMREDQSLSPGLGLTRTTFLRTPKITTSSLAFVITRMDTKELATINNITQEFAIRSSEINKTELFIESLNDLINNVELVMNYSLTLDALHHIMVKEISQGEVKSFYGINHYTEHLILFNSLLSPQTKEFSIRRMITAGLVSQFLGNIVSFASHNDAWIFNGIIKFLEYYIMSVEDSDDSVSLQEVQFISDIFADAVVSSAHHKVTQRAAYVFYMIYNVIGKDAFFGALRRLINENAYESISVDLFYELLQLSYEEHNTGITSYGDLRKSIESFVDYEYELTVNVGYSNDSLEIQNLNIKMPVNIKTPNQNDQNEIFWTDSSNFTKLIGNHDWVLINVDRFGCYRVNYDSNNWRNLIQALKTDPEVFSKQTIAQLVDDSLNFALFITYNMPFEIALSLLELIENETSYVVWSAAVPNLIDLNKRTYELDFHPHFVEFVHKISAKYADKIGFIDPGTTADEESMMDKFSRLKLIDLSCQLGLPECLNEMQLMLISYLNENNEETTVSVNLEEKFLCYGLMGPFEDGNGSEYFNKLLNKLHSTSDREQRLRFIGSLGCYPHIEQLLFYLNSTLRDSEYVHAMRSTYTRSNAGIEAVMMFIDENYDEIITKIGDDGMMTVLEEISKEIFNKRLYDKLEDLVEKLGFDNATRANLLVPAYINNYWRTSYPVFQLRQWFFSQTTTTITTETTTEITTTEAPKTTTGSGNFTKLSMFTFLFTTIMTIIQNLYW